MTHMLLMSFDDSRMMNLNRTLNRFFEYTFHLLQKKSIKFGYIGTASSDNVIERLFFSTFVRAKFGKHVKTSHLLLTKNKLSPLQIEKYITEQDILFVGGGNTEAMLQIWEKTGFTTVLNKLKNESRLPVLAGVSAGGMYPFHSGLSDAMPGHYKPLSCLSWINHSFCAHSNSILEAKCTFENNKLLKRLDAYASAVKLGLLPPGYAVPDDCMLHFYGDKLICALTSRKNSNCYFVSADKINPIDTMVLTAQDAFKIARDALAKNKQAILHQTEIIFKSECWQTFFKFLNIPYRLMSLLRWA